METELTALECVARLERVLSWGHVPLLKKRAFDIYEKHQKGLIPDSARFNTKGERVR